MKNIWTLSFKTSMYDFVMPITYKMSLKKSFELLNPSPGQLILDAGCGNGNLLTFAKDWLTEKNGALVGIDINNEGLRIAAKRAERYNLSDKNIVFKNQDLVHDTGTEMYDGIISHFALYTIKEHNDRFKAIINLKKQLKKNSLLVLALPSEIYNAAGIVKEAIREEEIRKRPFSGMYYVRKYFIYSLTKKALKTVEREMDRGTFHRFTADEIDSILNKAGFSDIQIQRSYGGHGYIATAKNR